MIRASAAESDSTIARHPSHRMLWKAAAASVALHALLAIVVLSLHFDAVDPPAKDGPLALRLIAVDATKREAEPVEDLAQATAPDASRAGTPNARPPSASDPAAPLPEPERIGAPRSGEPEPATRSGIAMRILEQVRQQAAGEPEDAAASLPWTPSGARIAGLPGVRGWLAGHAGAVRAGTERWQANDGATRARHVLADGTVVCTRRRAPAIDEAMHPWKSLVVTMAWACGRQRPEPADFADPRVQPPPRTAEAR